MFLESLPAHLVREVDPTSKILLAHCKNHYPENGGVDQLADLIINIVLLRNTMSKEVVKLCDMGQVPWLRIVNGHLTDASKKAADEMFLKLGGKVFFTNVQPMKDRAKCPRRGWSEFVSEIVAFAKKAKGMAQIWSGENAVENLAAEIRKVPGFGGKGFRMKERGQQHRDTKQSMPNV